MCEQDHLGTMPRVNRRQFARMGAVMGAGAIAACSSGDAGAEEEVAAGTIVETPVSFPAPGGTFDGVFIYKSGEANPGVILWPDIAGLRPAKVEMGRRLAEEGYSVLVANPYYRSVSGQQFDDFDAWRENDGFTVVGPWMEANTPEAIAETAVAVVAWLDEQDAVDTSRGIGNQGYCMTGSWTIRAAAAVPERVKVAASFHGGGLVGPEETSPVNLLDDVPADGKVLIAIAQNDDANAPGDKTALSSAGDAAEASVTVEVYQGDHGWTVLDSPVYNEAEAERAWSEMLAMYATL